MGSRVPLIVVSSDAVPRHYIISVGALASYPTILNDLICQTSLSQSLRQDDLELFCAPISTLWGGVPVLDSKNVITNQSNASELIHSRSDNRFILCLASRKSQPDPLFSAHHSISHSTYDVQSKAHSFCDVMSESHSNYDVKSKSNSIYNVKSESHSIFNGRSESHSMGKVNRSDCSDCEMVNVCSNCTHLDIHSCGCCESYGGLRVDESDCTTLGNYQLENDKKAELFSTQGNKKYLASIRTSPVQVACEMKSLVLAQDSSMCVNETKSSGSVRGNAIEIVSGSDSEDSDPRIQDTPLPGIQTVQYRLFPRPASKDTIETSFIPRPLTPCRVDANIESCTNSLAALDSSCRHSFENDVMIGEDIVTDSSFQGVPTAGHMTSDGSNNEIVTEVVEGIGRIRKHLGKVSSSSDVRVVVDYCGIQLTQSDMDTLRPHGWLNDQVINSYMKLLEYSHTLLPVAHTRKNGGYFSKRHKGCHSKRPRVHITSTFFYTKLQSFGYSGVERWMKNVDMNKLRLLLVPVHSGCHWSLAAVDFRRKTIQYYDSLRSRNSTCLKKLKYFLMKCSQNKKCQRVIHWRLCYPKGIPLQHNSSDCGVFVCQFARWLCSTRLQLTNTSNSKIPFSQSHIPEIRNRMITQLQSRCL